MHQQQKKNNYFCYRLILITTGTIKNYTTLNSSYTKKVSKRIRVPLTPDILKSSSNCTTFSLNPSLGSLSRTYINIFLSVKHLAK